MLALSLHNIGIVEVEDFALMNQGEERRAEMEQVVSAERSPASHLSITLPCKAFRDTATRYNITVSIFQLNDSLPTLSSKFLFVWYCILFKVTHLPFFFISFQIMHLQGCIHE